MLKNKRLQYLISLGCFFLIAVIIFILGSKYDYSFSRGLYDKYQLNIPGFSIICCLLGPIITNIFGAFAGTALFFTTNRKSKFWHYLLKFFGIFGIVGISFFAYTSGTEFVEVIPHVQPNQIAIGEMAVLFLVVGSDLVVGFFTWKNLKKLDQKKTFWVSLIMLFSIAAIAGLGEVIKYLASRPRPRLIFVNDTYSFKEWYQWNPLFGFKVHECKSFTSGHSMNAAVVMTMLPLFLSLTKLSEKKWMIPVSVTIGGVYWLVITLSRLLAVAHFLTDVAGACIFSIIFQLAILSTFEKIKNKTGDFTPVSNN